MNVEVEVVRVLQEVLSLGERGKSFTRDTLLLGAIPELDSMAVVSIVTALEERLGIVAADDELSGDVFASVGSLTDFVSAQLGR